MRSHLIGFSETVLQDIRYARRGLLRAPTFTVAAVLALVLGIGSATAMFSVVDPLLFRSLPYPHSERLVSFGMMAPLDTAEFVLSADWPEWRAAAASFESVTALSPARGVCDLAGGDPIRVSCVPVEATFLKTLGVQPAIGRDFTLDEDRPEGPRAAIISRELWQSRFAGLATVVGRRITVDGNPVTIVGVLPQSFEMPNLATVDLLLTQQLPFVSHPNSGRPLRAFGRLKPGVSIAQAESSLQPMFRQALQWVPEAFRNEVTLRIRSLRDRQIQNVRLASWLLFGSVLAVMLIACANVSNLLLARAAARRQEFAVRSAIGAGRARLVRQALTEGLVLAAIGGVLGSGLAAVLIRLMIRIAPAGIPRLEQAAIDARSLLFAAATAALSAVIFSVVPGLYSPSAGALTARARTTKGVVRHSLVASQIAISLVLLTVAGLLLRTLWNLQTIPLGMRTDNVIAAPILLRQPAYSSAEQQRLFFEELEARLRALPGLGDVALSDSVPLDGPVLDVTGRLGTHAHPFASIRIEGQAPFEQGMGGLVGWRQITPDYFRVLEIPIIRGRAFEEADRRSEAQVIIVSESLAQRLFPNHDVVGKRIRIPSVQSAFKTIIGVARNAKNNPGLSGADDPEYYVPRKHDESEGASPQGAILLRTPLEPSAAINAIRSVVSAMDPALPVNVYAMQERVSELAARPRFNAVLLVSFAGVGVLLAAIGMYGVISFLIVQRSQEIGVRLALGATSTNIMTLVFSAAMRWTLLGIAAGLFGSFFTTQLLRTLLFNVQEHDPWTLSVATILMVSIAAAAAWLPSRRAATMDPLVALRQE